MWQRPEDRKDKLQSVNKCNQLREVVRQFEDMSVLTQQTTENVATKLPLDNIRSHNVQGPTTLFRRVFCPHTSSNTPGRKGQENHVFCGVAAWHQKRRYHGSLSLHTVKSKRWSFRKLPVLSCQSRGAVSSTAPQIIQETLEPFQGEHVPTCQRDPCTRKCVRQ